MIERLAARIAELEAALGQPRKTSSNSHLPPSKDGPGRKNRPDRPAKPRPSRPGASRPLSPTPDKTERCMASECRHCGKDVSAAPQRCRQRYDHIDLPVIRPIVTRVEIFGGRCGQCGRRYRAEAPVAMEPGTPFGPGIRSLLMYLHDSHHVIFERMSRMLGELFGLTISEGAISNAFSRMGSDMAKACQAIKQKLVTARIIASDETTTRVDGVTQWQWAEPAKVSTMQSIGGKQAEGFISDKAVLHEIAPRRAKSVAEEVLAGHKPAVWISDRYAGQQELGERHQVCLAHVLRDVQYAIDCGDTIFAPKSATICVGPSGWGKDEANSRTARWRSTPQKLTPNAIA